MMPLTFLPAPCRAHAAGTEGGMSGAGAILGQRLSMMPRLQPRPPRSHTAGEGPGVRAALTSPLLSHAVGEEGGNVGTEAKAYWPSPKWLHRHGTCSIRNPGV
jgi:hypothetical protein